MKSALAALLSAAGAPKRVAECLASEDHQEGVRAFLEKRAPRFRGR